MFQGEIFNEGEFEETIFKPPFEKKLPLEGGKVKKLTSKVMFEVK